MLNRTSVQSLSSVWLFVTPWLQHARLPCPSPAPGACSNSCPFGDAIRPYHPLSSPSPPAFNLSQHQGPNESVLRIKWPKCWSFSFSISPSNEYAGLISFRMYWFDFLAVQGTLKSLLKSLLSPPLSVVLLSAVLVIVLNHGLQRLNGKFQK